MKSIIVYVVSSLICLGGVKEQIEKLEKNIPPVKGSRERGMILTIDGVSIPITRLESWSRVIKPKNQEEDAIVFAGLKSENKFVRYICAGAIFESRGIFLYPDSEISLKYSLKEKNSEEYLKLVKKINKTLRTARTTDPPDERRKK